MGVNYHQQRSDHRSGPNNYDVSMFASIVDALWTPSLSMICFMPSSLVMSPKGRITPCSFRASTMHGTKTIWFCSQL